MRPIAEIAEAMGLDPSLIIPYGKYKAKVPLDAIRSDGPRGSIFGVGDYFFSRCKVAISGLDKKLEIVEVGPFQGRPVVLDDTCYFSAC